MKVIERRTLLTLALVAMSLQVVTTAVADPLPGRDVLKFSQKPLDGRPLFSADGTRPRFWGHDELSTAYSQVTPNGPTPYRGIFMADDFADKFSTPVVHVKWWGSYLNNFVNPALPVDKFLISFERDVPASTANPFSRPGEPLLNQIVKRGPLAPGSGTFTEKPISGGGPPLNETLYEYNAELHLDKAFFQDPNTVYWLKIVAMVDVPAGINLDPANPPTFVTRWGWHNRDYWVQNPLASPAVEPGEEPAALDIENGFIWHFQDDAVTVRVAIDHLSTPMGSIMPRVEQGEFRPTRYVGGVDGFPYIADFSKDLAFELFTVPEPAAFMLIAISLASVAVPRRRTA
ncbi:MAG TPA: hypothetical protein VHK01_07670 [Lacipirellulaceae bacterium]|nr:hypothetical protein [Lacipirellulaceae bacterium]